VIKRQITGTGMTKHELISFDDEADRAEPEIARRIERSTIEGVLSSVERRCFPIMKEVGLPDHHGSWCYNPKGEWREIDPELLFSRTGWGMANGIWPIAEARGFAPDSPIGFAARMLSDVVSIRRAQDAGNLNFAALRFGDLRFKEAEEQLKALHEPTWRTGKKQREYLNETRDLHNRRRHRDRAAEWAHWNAEARKIWLSKPLLSKEAVARKLKRDLALSDGVRTIRARIKKVGEAG
jgi:hypothetical protein